MAFHRRSPRLSLRGALIIAGVVGIVLTAGAVVNGSPQSNPAPAHPSVATVVADPLPLFGPPPTCKPLAHDRQTDYQATWTPRDTTRLQDGRDPGDVLHPLGVTFKGDMVTYAWEVNPTLVVTRARATYLGDGGCTDISLAHHGRNVYSLTLHLSSRPKEAILDLSLPAADN